MFSPEELIEVLSVSEDSVKSYQMNSGSGNKRGQATQQIQRAKHNMSGSVPIGSFEFINHLT